MSDTDLVVAITGASSGIGRATARLLADRGHAVVLGARREGVLAALASELNNAGGRAEYHVTDVTLRTDLEALVARAVERFGRLDAIVNNAGIAPISRFDALRVEDWDAMIDVNLRGVLYGIAAALPVFGRQGRGHVVNVISTAGLKILPTMGVRRDQERGAHGDGGAAAGSRAEPARDRGVARRSRHRPRELHDG